MLLNIHVESIIQCCFCVDIHHLIYKYTNTYMLKSIIQFIIQSHTIQHIIEGRVFQALGKKKYLFCQCQDQMLKFRSCLAVSIYMNTQKNHLDRAYH